MVIYKTKMSIVHIQCLLRIDGSILPGVFLTSSCVVPQSSVFQSNAARSSLFVHVELGTRSALVQLIQPPVRLVQFQPDHSFPHLWLAWRCQLASLLGGCPCNAPKHTGTMLKLARWLRTVQQNCSATVPTTFRSYKRIVSQASPVKGVAFGR